MSTKTLTIEEKVRRTLRKLGIDENTQPNPENPSREELLASLAYAFHEVMSGDTCTWEEILAELEEEGLID